MDLELNPILGTRKEGNRVVVASKMELKEERAHSTKKK